MQTKDWPDVTPGSIIAFTGRATRGSEGETREVFALVMSQEPYDGSLSCFAFHFEGQFQAVLPPVTRTPVRGPDGVLTGMDVQPTFRVVFNAEMWEELTSDIRSLRASSVHLDSVIADLRETVANDIQTLQRQMTEFQTQVLEMITSGSVDPAAKEPAHVDSTRKTK